MFKQEGDTEDATTQQEEEMCTCWIIEQLRTNSHHKTDDQFKMRYPSERCIICVAAVHVVLSIAQPQFSFISNIPVTELFLTPEKLWGRAQKLVNTLCKTVATIFLSYTWSPQKYSAQKRADFSSWGSLENQMNVHWLTWLIVLYWVEIFVYSFSIWIENSEKMSHFFFSWRIFLNNSLKRSNLFWTFEANHLGAMVVYPI